MSFRYNLPYSVTLGPQQHSFFRYPPVAIKPLGSLPPSQPTTADTVLRWGFWIGVGFAAHRLYRVLRYDDPFFQFGGGVPEAWEINAGRSRAEMKLLKEELYRIYDEDMDVEFLARHLDVSQDTVRRWLREAGVSYKAATTRRRKAEKKRLQSLQKAIEEHRETNKAAYPKLTKRKYQQAIVCYEQRKPALIERYKPNYPRKKLLELKVECFGEPTGARKEIIKHMFKNPYAKIIDVAHAFGASPEQVKEWLREEGFIETEDGQRMTHGSTIEEFIEKQRSGRLLGLSVSRTHWRRNPSAEEFDQVCAYCKRIWIEGKWVPGEPESELATHGICDQCQEILLQEIEEMEKEEIL